MLHKTLKGLKQKARLPKGMLPDARLTNWLKMLPIGSLAVKYGIATDDSWASTIWNSQKSQVVQAPRCESAHHAHTCFED